MKNVQIPQDLLYDLFRYFLLDERDEYVEETITTALQAKLDAMTRREYYTLSKTAETPAEREKARQTYLDMVGMLPGWRWPEGYRDGPPD